MIGVLGSYTHGACLCPIEFFEPRKVLETVARERCTALYGVPTMFLAQLEHPDFPRFDLSSLRTGIMAGSLCPEALMRRVIADMHLPEMTIAYGLTEASPGITQTSRDDSLEHRTQTVGRVLPEMDVKIVDPGDRRAGLHGRAGRALRARLQRHEGLSRQRRRPRGRRSTRTAGFAPATRRRWTTRDTCASPDGSKISSSAAARTSRRRRSKICSASTRRSPTSYVYGVASEWFGEEVAAAVRVKPGTPIAAEALAAFCEGRLARFKVPRFIRFVDDFPMTASGKIQKFKLREMHESELQRVH